MAARPDSIYAETKMEGNLFEKKVLQGKTKFYAQVQGPALYLQKGGVMNMIDLSKAHQVQKNKGDSSGTQLEICFPKKKTVFICPSSSECEDWIRALRGAMVHKDSFADNSGEVSSRTTSTYYTEEDTYATISESSISKIDSQYGNPIDSLVSASPNENVYASVDEQFCKRVNTEEEDGEIYCDATSSKPKDDNENKLIDSKPQDNSSQKQVHINPPETDDSELYTDATSEFPRKTDSDCSQISDIVISTNTVTDDYDNEGVDDIDDLFETMAQALSEVDLDLNGVEHPLKEDDCLAFQDLSEFLNNNRSVCRVSSHIVGKCDDDPVVNLKHYLKTLNMPS